MAEKRIQTGDGSLHDTAGYAEFQNKEHIIILCDSWYTKQNLVSIVDEYPNLNLIGNARIDSVMYMILHLHAPVAGDVLQNTENNFTSKQILPFPMKRLQIIISASVGF